GGAPVLARLLLLLKRTRDCELRRGDRNCRKEDCRSHFVLILHLIILHLTDAATRRVTWSTRPSATPLSASRGETGPSKLEPSDRHEITCLPISCPVSLS